MRAAIAHGAEYVVQMDADLSHQPEVIPELLGTMLSTDAGLVIGSQYVIGGSLLEALKLPWKLLIGR